MEDSSPQQHPPASNLHLGVTETSHWIQGEASSQRRWQAVNAGGDTT